MPKQISFKTVANLDLYDFNLSVLELKAQCDAWLAEHGGGAHIDVSTNLYDEPKISLQVAYRENAND